MQYWLIVGQLAKSADSRILIAILLKRYNVVLNKEYNESDESNTRNDCATGRI